MPRKKATPVVVPKRIGRPPRRLQFNEEAILCDNADIGIRTDSSALQFSDTLSNRAIKLYKTNGEEEEYDFVEIPSVDTYLDKIKNIVKVSIRENAFGVKNKTELTIAIGINIAKKFLSDPIQKVTFQYVRNNPNILFLKESGNKGRKVKAKSNSYYFVNILTNEPLGLKPRKLIEAKHKLYKGGLLINLEEKDNG